MRTLRAAVGVGSVADKNGYAARIGRPIGGDAGVVVRRSRTAAQREVPGGVGDTFVRTCVGATEPAAQRADRRAHPTGRTTVLAGPAHRGPARYPAFGATRVGVDVCASRATL